MKTRFSCIAEAHESTRQRIESVTKEFTKTTLQGKDQNSVLQCNLVHIFIPMPQAMKIPDAKTAVDKEWKKLEIVPSWQLDNMKDKQEVILDAQKESKNIHFATLMDICSAIRIMFPPCTWISAQAQKIRTKLRFTHLLKFRQCRRPFQNPRRKQFVVDSGASMHILSNRDLSADDMKTVRRSRNLRTVVTANVEVQTNEKAQVYVHDLDLFVTVQIFDDTPAGLSLGKLCEEHGYSYESASGQEPRFTKQGKKKDAKQKNVGPTVVPGLSTGSSSSSETSSTSFRQDSSSTFSSPAREWPRGSGKPLARPPIVVRVIHRDSQRHFSWLRFGTASESCIQDAQYFKIHLPKDRN